MLLGAPPLAGLGDGVRLPGLLPRHLAAAAPPVHGPARPRRRPDAAISATRGGYIARHGSAAEAKGETEEGSGTASSLLSATRATRVGGVQP